MSDEAVWLLVGIGLTVIALMLLGGLLTQFAARRCSDRASSRRGFDS